MSLLNVKTDKSVSFVNNDEEHVSWRMFCSKVNKLAKLNKLTF